MDEGGNIALGYSISDATMFPSINVTGRLTSDPLGTLGSEISMFAGLWSANGRPQPVGRLHPDVRRPPRRVFVLVHQPVPACERVVQLGDAHRVVPLSRLRGAPTRTITGFVNDGLGNPIANAVVDVDAGFSGATDATGRYTIVLLPGSYNVIATDPASSCTPSASFPATVTNGATTTQNFALTGAASLAVKSTFIDDSSGNGNGIINRDECFKLNVDLTNAGCSGASGISASVTTSTPGVEILGGTSSYPNIARAADAFGATPFSLATTAAFVCCPTSP